MFLGTAALFSLALALGGLGPHAPLLGGLIEAAAFPLLIAVVSLGSIQSIGRREHVGPILFLALLVGLGLAQLLPLPAHVWRDLPGREVSQMVLTTLGQADRPRPLSLAPEDTRLAIQAWIPPIAIFAATLVATRQERSWLAGLVVLAAAISSVLGLLQLSFGDGTFFLDPGGISTRYPGLFANYNHQAVFLAAAVALLPSVRYGERRALGAHDWPVAAFWALALVGTLITSSRAGLALFALSSTITALQMLRRTGPAHGVRLADHQRKVLVFLAAAGGLVLALWLAASGYRAELLSTRFGTVESDFRYEFWRITLDAATSFLPFGAGFGTFESAYQLTEPLENVRDFIVNHAHNDYLEIILEAGIAGALLILLFLMWFAGRLVALVRSRGLSDPLAWSGATIVILVLLHSLVDYPLRTEAIGCVFAFACALLISSADGIPDRARTRVPGLRRLDP